MKLFKDIAVGEKFVLGNGQQLIRISPLMDNSERPVRTENCLDYPFYQKRFAIENNSIDNNKDTINIATDTSNSDNNQKTLTTNENDIPKEDYYFNSSLRISLITSQYGGSH